jgi:sterol desaturase/sphingolipid hydroxylase (fatty acid hydroxylase superfamily)
VEAVIINNESSIRLGFFFGILLLMALLELGFPRRKLKVSKFLRWRNNLTLLVLNTLILRLLIPGALVGLTLFVNDNGWGLFNFYQLSSGVALIASIVILDFVIYLQHVMVHAIPLFWHIHRVHHADLDYDVTTGIRFHPLEILLSMLVKFTAVALVGPPLMAVIVFEVLLNALAMFNHSNLKLPSALDRLLRLFIVTPDMHRVHHSIYHDEANSNFGFNLSLWDRLFGTYMAQPRDGHEAMQIGIDDYQNENQVARLPGILLLPFMGKLNAYAINRREWKSSSPED